ncbi:hypothetical protein GQ53DRAFT_821423 [Thozetella sp. PMI_491]|nr:hypothetical protein GQ53DRAFT_821423 [Thozetella sp. PMI_491]
MSDSPADPFCIFPVKMKYQSWDVFHDFINERTSLAHIAQRDATAVRLDLGPAQENMLCLHAVLCMRSAYRSFRDCLESQQTYLYHRNALLQWLKENISNRKMAIKAQYLCIVASVIMADSTSGDELSVRANLKGAIALLDLRKQTEKEWRFFDALLKQFLIMFVALP